MERLFEFVQNHPFLVAAFIGVGALLLRDLWEFLTRKYQVITPLKAVMMINEEDAAVVDVREPHEWKGGHIPGAFLVSLGELEEKIPKLIADKDRPLIVTCQIGTRSPAACRKLNHLGYTRVYLLRGGMQAWENENLPLSKTS